MLVHPMAGRWALRSALLKLLCFACVPAALAARGRQDVQWGTQLGTWRGVGRDIYRHYPKHYYSLFEQRFQEYSKMHSEVSTLP